MHLNKELKALAAGIKLLVLDCDGVLTDGRLYFGEKGEALKVFHVRDGQGIASWHQAGFTTAIVSARSSPMLRHRAAELGIKYLSENIKNKCAELTRICDSENMDLKDVAFVGDDLADLEVLNAVGLPVAVADGAAEVIDAAVLVTNKNGGHGAVREVTDMLLLARK